MKIASSLVEGELEFTNTKGDVVKVIPYCVNVARLAEGVTKKRIELAAAKEPEAIGKAVVDLMGMLLGEKSAAEIIDYYKGDYSTMAIDLTPFFVAEIFPSFDRYRQRVLESQRQIKKVRQK